MSPAKLHPISSDVIASCPLATNLIEDGGNEQNATTAGIASQARAAESEETERTSRSATHLIFADALQVYVGHLIVQLSHLLLLLVYVGRLKVRVPLVCLCVQRDANTGQMDLCRGVRAIHQNHGGTCLPPFCYYLDASSALVRK